MSLYLGPVDGYLRAVFRSPFGSRQEGETRGQQDFQHLSPDWEGCLTKLIWSECYFKTADWCSINGHPTVQCFFGKRQNRAKIVANRSEALNV
jgi:hypothetical protein